MGHQGLGLRRGGHARRSDRKLAEARGGRVQRGPRRRRHLEQRVRPRHHQPPRPAIRPRWHESHRVGSEGCVRRRCRLQLAPGCWVRLHDEPRVDRGYEEFRSQGIRRERQRAALDPRQARLAAGAVPLAAADDLRPVRQRLRGRLLEQSDPVVRPDVGGPLDVRDRGIGALQPPATLGRLVRRWACLRCGRRELADRRARRVHGSADHGPAHPQGRPRRPDLEAGRSRSPAERRGRRGRPVGRRHEQQPDREVQPRRQLRERAARRPGIRLHGRAAQSSGRPGLRTRRSALRGRHEQRPDRVGRRSRKGIISRATRARSGCFRSRPRRPGWDPDPSGRPPRSAATRNDRSRSRSSRTCRSGCR